MLYSATFGSEDVRPVSIPSRTRATMDIKSRQTSTGVVGETIMYATLPSTRAYTPDSPRRCTTSTASFESYLSSETMNAKIRRRRTGVGRQRPEGKRTAALVSRDSVTSFERNRTSSNVSWTGAHSTIYLDLSKSNIVGSGK